MSIASAQEAPEISNQTQRAAVRYTEHPEGPRAQPSSRQVAPASIHDLRTPASSQATTNHFEGEHDYPNNEGLITETFPEVDNYISTLDPFFRDSNLTLNIRSAYFRTENEASTPLAQAWALGGSFIYESGWFRDFLHLGAGYYTSNGLYKPTGEGTTLLLKDEPDRTQHNINVLGQMYVEFKHDIYRLKLYRQKLDTPFINEHFDRMIPQLFEAYILGTKNLQPEKKGQGYKRNPDFPINFMAGYVSEELNRGSTTFVPLSSVATKNTTNVDRGVIIGGLEISPANGVSTSIWEYYGLDMFNTIYTEAEGQFNIDEDGALEGKFAVQFIDQRSVGDAIVGKWSSQVIGLLAGVSYEGFAASLRYNYNFGGVGIALNGAANSFGIQSPWGRFPSFNKSTVLDRNTADTAIYGIWASYNFNALSSQLEGLEFSTSYTYASIEASSLRADESNGEFDITLKYTIPALKGLFFEARGSWVSFNDRPGSYVPAINDYRLYLNYTIPLL
ncbi:OprD family outer membrane porin [Rubellicoccus peritrichatus]|uniref:OprD family outer membrane porin n=1 Tax=Rubellicoccus peritrichatus TaxID=3080537 RepID=A0AAQ3QTU6_9BACT|nr:OprD family outer membrane porin [Puniceicoccus sp. CR14]WOO41716.1 OprD family outer membrane porin [Puniceicoccus sp. CR14]